MRSSLTPSPRDEHVTAPCVPGMKEDPCTESLSAIEEHPESTTHSHGHDHSHGHAASRKRLAIALAITAMIFITELVAAFFTSSLSLAADNNFPRQQRQNRSIRTKRDVARKIIIRTQGEYNLQNYGTRPLWPRILARRGYRFNRRLFRKTYEENIVVNIGIYLDGLLKFSKG